MLRTLRPQLFCECVGVTDGASECLASVEIG